MQRANLADRDHGGRRQLGYVGSGIRHDRFRPTRLGPWRCGVAEQSTRRVREWPGPMARHDIRGRDRYR